MCGRHNGYMGSNCKRSDPENFDFVSKNVCDGLNASWNPSIHLVITPVEPPNAGQECLLAHVCDTT